MRRLAFTLVAITLGACGLSVTGIAVQDEAIATPEGGTPDAPAAETSAPGDTGTSAPADVGAPDASTPTDAAGAPDAAVDASVDASLDASNDGATAASKDAGDGGDAGDAGALCSVLLDEDFSAPLVGWQAVGSSPGLDAPANLYRLTAKGDDTVSRGLWHTQPLTFTGTLRATVDFVIDPTSTNGTGISLVWGASADFRTGGASLGLGICGNDIFGVAAQYRFETGRVYSVTSTNGSCGTGGFENIQTGNAGALKLTLTGTTVTGQVDMVADNARTATFNKTGYIGITASTDNSGRSGIGIKRVRVLSCP